MKLLIRRISPSKPSQGLLAFRRLVPSPVGEGGLEGGLKGGLKGGRRVEPFTPPSEGGGAGGGTKGRRLQGGLKGA